ncbi:MAG: hypothetical protein P0Y65_09555 [Candidatus Devosia phytovorans]|uniref:Tat pathway signal sequence domain protein n=1 Tax=Candidatus Devosia phytovorans TaxID=3121372 RepID=A0AAJ5VXA9_9HYPH|nr:hypothetical protein [Devosia sp.]WEK06464.1 MAG: hypothetical protein P0Y65_09555 [Devosia sp.]
MKNALAIIFALCCASPAIAQDTPVAPENAAAFTLELNALHPAAAGCRVTFLATNELGSQLDRASVEMALFDSAGTIDRIVTLDFRALSQGKTKVLQFELAGLDCDNVGRVLINDITACEGPDLVATACLAGLVTTTRSDIAFGA